MAMFGFGCPKCWERECNCHLDESANALAEDVRAIKKELWEVGFAAQVALNNFDNKALVIGTLKMIAKFAK